MASAVMTTLLNGSGLVSDLTQTKFAVESLQYAKDCRGEDVAHRMQVGEVERRRVDNARRNVDEKAAQLKSISHLSALIAGFSMVTMVEVTIPENANRVLVALFAAASSTTVRSPPAPPPPPPERPHCASPSHPSYPYYRPVCGFSLPLARGPTATAGRSNTAFLPSFLSENHHHQVGLMLIAMTTCTLAMVGLYNYDPDKRPDASGYISFNRFWNTKVNDEWERSLWVFCHGGCSARLLGLARLGSARSALRARLPARPSEEAAALHP